ncbi:MAG: T9SS type A sorting domain-containing protein, partial [Melioribacteraceae bacterium]|nr:T9SS type A sorting domain-containing protein [Melioribacteraceae bacterium]
EVYAYKLTLSTEGTLFLVGREAGLTAFEYSPLSSFNETQTPNNFELSQNYPNPFNPSTSIKYSIPRPSNITLKIFDVLGSEVTTLIDKKQPRGNYEVEFDPSADGVELTSGIYFYRLQAGDYVETNKMILLK